MAIGPDHPGRLRAQPGLVTATKLHGKPIRKIKPQFDNKDAMWAALLLQLNSNIQLTPEQVGQLNNILEVAANTDDKKVPSKEKEVENKLITGGDDQEVCENDQEVAEVENDEQVPTPNNVGKDQEVRGNDEADKLDKDHEVRENDENNKDEAGKGDNDAEVRDDGAVDLGGTGADQSTIQASPQTTTPAFGLVIFFHKYSESELLSLCREWYT